jgi:hypothetical protein
MRTCRCSSTFGAASLRGWTWRTASNSSAMKSFAVYVRIGDEAALFRVYTREKGLAPRDDQEAGAIVLF